MQRLSGWPVTAAVAALIATAYGALCIHAPRELLPYLIAFALLFTVFICLNPRRRYFRLGSATVGVLLAPFIASGLLYLNFGRFGFIQVVASDPGPAFYVAGTVIALACFLLDAAINSDSRARVLLRRIEFFSRNQWTIGGNNTQAIIENNTGPVTVNTGVHHWPDSSGIHAEVTAAAKQIGAGLPDVAIELLNQILARASRDDKRLQYRIHANLGNAHLERDDTSAAVAEFQKAIQFEKDTEDSLGLVALSHLLRDEVGQANAAAKDALEKFPSSTCALSVYIQSAPADREPVDFSDILKSPQDNHIEVLYALSLRASEQHRFPTALELARRAVKQLPDSPRLLEHLATTILNGEGLAFRDHKIAGGPRPNNEALTEATSIYTGLLKKSKHLTPTTLGRIHHRIAICHFLSGDIAAARKHFATSITLAPSSVDTRRHYVQFLVNQNETESAISQLREFPAGDLSSDDRLLLAMLLYATHDTGSEREVFEMLRDDVGQLATATTDTAVEWLGLLCQSAHATGNCDWFERERVRLLGMSSKAWMTFAFTAECRLYHKDVGQATEALRSWVGSLSPDDNIMQRQWCSRLCQQVGLFELALECWKPVAIASPGWPYWHQVLHCAMQCQDDAYVLSYCEQLRNNGCLDAHCLHAELDTLGKYHDDSKAIELIQSYIERVTDRSLQNILRVRLSIFAIRCGRMDLVDTDDARMPPSDAVDEDGGVWTTEVLRRAGQREKAVRYGYALLRRFQQSVRVNQVFVAAFDLGGIDIRPTTDCVVEDDAVLYREDDTGQLHWVVIEGNPQAKLANDEIDPAHPLAKALLGKKKGESFVLRPDDIQPRTATIQEVRSKYAYRAVDIIDHWETRFPGVHFVKKFVAGKKPDGSLDVSAMFKTMHAMAADDEVRRQAYINNPIGIAIYADMCHLTHIQAAYLIGMDSEMPNRCSTGHQKENDDAIASVHVDSVVVLDPSAVTTIFVTGLYEIIDRLPTKCLVTHSTVLTFKEELTRVSGGRTPKGYMRSVNGQLRYVEHDEDSYANYTNRLQAFLAWLETNAESRGGSDASQLPRDTRQQYEELFGSAYVESACLAKKESAIHWTDDVTVAMILDREMKVPRCWTQAYIAAMTNHGKIPEEAAQRVAVELLRFGVEFTHWTPKTVIAAAKTCEWKCDRRPLKAVTEFLRRADARVIVGCVVQLCVLVQEEPILTSQMEDFLLALLRVIAERSDGEIAIGAIARVIPVAFGMNVAQAERVRQLLVHALRTASGSRLILPEGA